MVFIGGQEKNMLMHGYNRNKSSYGSPFVISRQALLSQTDLYCQYELFSVMDKSRVIIPQVYSGMGKRLTSLTTEVALPYHMYIQTARIHKLICPFVDHMYLSLSLI